MSNQSVNHCSICSPLQPEEYAFQKLNSPDDNSYLPPAVHKLVLVKDLDPYGGRKHQILQCPECQTYYYYRTDYEYLVNGATEDEEFLTRLTDAEAADYLK